MIIDQSGGEFIGGIWVWHRQVPPPKPAKEKENGELNLPTTEEGVPVPMLFGRCRIRNPILAWHGPLRFEDRGGGFFYMRMNMFFVLASGFQHGDGISTPVATNKIHAMWAGDRKMPDGGLTYPPLSDLTGNGAFENPSFVTLVRDDYSIVGNVEFLNGGPAQQLNNAGPTTWSGYEMTQGPPEGESLSENDVPGYRDVLGALLFQSPLGFNHGTRSTLSTYNFEASSYHNHSRLGTYRQVGLDSNPANVIYEVLTSTLNKLGLSTDLIDMDNFVAVQYVLHTESNGYSRCWTDRASGADIIIDVLRQIDAFIYEDFTTGKIKLKLVRPDFDPTTIPEINKFNCSALRGFAMGSQSNLINKIVVKFPNREKNYDDDSATAQSLANAVGGDGHVAEESLEYRGCCDADLAKALAERELGVRSRPIVKCTAIVERTLLRVNVGDPVKVVWTNPDVNAVFRVVRVNRGTLEDGHIALDLASESAYVWRNRSPLPPSFGGIDRPPVISIGP